MYQILAHFREIFQRNPGYDKKSLLFMFVFILIIIVERIYLLMLSLEESLVAVICISLLVLSEWLPYSLKYIIVAIRVFAIIMAMLFLILIVS